MFMESNDRSKKLFLFLDETIEYFLEKVKHIDRDKYFADRDSRNILDKTINDIILCMVDISEECLKQQRRSIPDTYKDTILACFEFFGELVLKIAPLTKQRNETIHHYLKLNWQNIMAINNKIEDIKEFSSKARSLLS